MAITIVGLRKLSPTYKPRSPTALPHNPDRLITCPRGPRHRARLRDLCWASLR